MSHVSAGAGRHHIQIFRVRRPLRQVLRLVRGGGGGWREVQRRRHDPGDYGYDYGGGGGGGRGMLDRTWRRSYQVYYYIIIIILMSRRFHV